MLALIPVVVFGFIVAHLLVESVPAVQDVGLGELFSTEFAGGFTSTERAYGLLPAIWGTLLAVMIAVGIALPVSLAMAVFASEFTFGFLGRGIRGLLWILSGIPPILYALMAIVFVELFMIPNFAGQGLEQIPPPGMDWWNHGALPTAKFGGNSTLMGGIVLAMLVIPFMAPMMDDAIRNVPLELKEASLGLGANRWHTLRKVTLPSAISGIMSATALGSLKSMGDVLIVAWVIGLESGLPSPGWDIFERTAPLTATGAGLGGGFEFAGSCGGTDCSVAYLTCLMLLVMAIAVLIVLTLLERRFKRRTSGKPSVC
jgi:phosphate transport system permease protein